MRNDGDLCILDINLCHKNVSIMNYVCKDSTKSRNKRRKSEKFLKSFAVSYILRTFASDDES